MRNFRTGLYDIPLNDWALDILKPSEWFVQNKHYEFMKATCIDKKDKIDHYTGEEYRKKIMDMGTKHDGFPEIIYSHSFSFNNVHLTEKGYENAKLITDKCAETFESIMFNFCLRRNALFSVYPPGGFISWHNNANAAAYNFIFTWSETGDGWFKYWDWKTNKVIKMPDVPGWQCKAGYFGAYRDPKESWCYHAARTNCLRMTIAFTLDRSEVGLGLQNEIIDDLSQ